jgi:hypothetical protein
MAATAYIQDYQPFAFDDFSGGINLRDKADTVGDKEAIDLLNVTFTERGAIRQRDGYSDLTSADLTNRVDSISAYYTAGGVKQLVAGCGTRLEAIDTGGAIVASATGLTGPGPYSMARFAAPGSEHLYATNGVDAPRRWDGSAWTTPTATVNGTAASAMPKAGAFAVTAALPGSTAGSNANNRLVAGAYPAGATTSGPGGTASNPSRVHFSNAGDPLTWETDGAGSPVRGQNWRDLTPGDGEAILGIVSWQELTFIFKQTKFFVLWGESTAADGTPTFQIREVISGVGLAARGAVTVGRDGVYFLGLRGVYVTTGGPPQILSDKISPLWRGDPDIYYQGSPVNTSQIALARLAWMDDQLYVAVPTGAATANDRTLVYDTQHQWWSIYDVPAAAMCAFRRADRDELHFGYSATLTPKRIGRIGLSILTDRGTAMTSRWRSGWSDYGQPVVKTFRETKAWAYGAVNVSFATDYNKAMTVNAGTVFNVPSLWPAPGGTWADWIASNGGNWPSAGEVSDRMIRRAVQGTTFSTQFSNHPSTQTWAMHRVVRHLRETRGTSVL